MKRRSRGARAALCAATLACAPARAAEPGGFQVETLELRAPGTGLLGVAGPPALPTMGFALDLAGVASGEPLLLSPAGAGDPRPAGAVVERRLGLELTGAFAPWRWLAAHGALPATAANESGRYGDLAAASLGDARLGATAGLFGLLGLGRPLGLELGLDATLWLPTGGEGALAGEGSMRAQPSIVADLRWGPLTALGQLGWHVRPEARAYNVRRDDEVRAGLAAELALPLGLAARAAASALVPVGDTGADAAVEALAGATWRFLGGFHVEGAAGRGLTEAPGSPSWRGLLRFGYSTPEPPAPVSAALPDRDRDEVPDDRDECPYEAEDRNGVRDADGCPDELPASVLGAAGPGTAPPGSSGSPGPGGAPAPTPLPPLQPAPDTDTDGLPDEMDACPAAPEDRDGFADGDGCPEPDNDADGVPDTADRCPAVAEIVNGFEDLDGCPDLGPDADKDGVEDLFDECPALPETPNGERDTDGCPESGLPPLPPLPPLEIGP